MNLTSTKHDRRLLEIEKIIAKLGESALSAIGVAVLIANRHGLITFANDKAAELTGWPMEQSLGMQLSDVFRLDRQRTVRDDHQVGVNDECVKHAAASNRLIHLINRAGRRVEIKPSRTTIRGRNGLTAGELIIFVDMNEKQLAVNEIARQKECDPLTGLLNRQSFTADLESAIEEYRKGNTPRVLCYINIDHFKLVNDTCGHRGGDSLLQWITSLLREETRESDILGRLGSDEFGILLNNCKLSKAQRIARNIHERLGNLSFNWKDRSFGIALRIGVIPLTSDIGNVDDLLFTADHACLQAREIGGSQIYICKSTDPAVRRQQKDMDCAAAMKRDLQFGRFQLFGQAIRPLTYEHSDRLHFEVLLRPLTASGKLGSPQDVIRAAELYGGMELLDRWVIRNTLQNLKKGMAKSSDRLDLCSINLSGLSLKSEGLLEYIHEQIAESAIPPAKVCFEITETSAVNNLSKAQWLIEGISAIGCRFALDDFGTGMASYSYLKDLPIDFLKIDGVFIKDIMSNSLNRTIVESVNQISHFLGIETIAEFVRSQSIFDELLGLGVDYAQGYWTGKPMPLTDLFKPDSILPLPPPPKK